MSALLMRQSGDPHDAIRIAGGGTVQRCAQLEPSALYRVNLGGPQWLGLQWVAGVDAFATLIRRTTTWTPWKLDPHYVHPRAKVAIGA